jgi:autotransporter-associated beta strand protein
MKENDMERTTYKLGLLGLLKNIRGKVMVVTAAAWLAFTPTPQASAVCLVPNLIGGGCAVEITLPLVDDILNAVKDLTGIGVLDDGLLTISGEDLVGNVLGGKHEAGDGDLTGSLLDIVGGSTGGSVIGMVIGGLNTDDQNGEGIGGNVIGSILNLIGGEGGLSLEGGDIYGGYSDKGDATGNKLNLLGGPGGLTLGEDLLNIVGGVVNGVAGNATGNIVSLDGLIKVADGLTEQISIIGGMSNAENASGDRLTGNTLNLGGALDLVGSIAGNLPIIGSISRFENINFADGIGDNLLGKIGLIDLSILDSEGLVNLNILGDLGLNAEILSDDGVLSLGLGGHKLTLLGDLSGHEGSTNILGGLLQIGNGEADALLGNSLVGDLLLTVEGVTNGLLGFHLNEGDDDYTFSGDLIGGTIGGLLNNLTSVGGIGGLTSVLDEDGVVGNLVGGLLKDGLGKLSLLGDLTKFTGDMAILDGILSIGGGGSKDLVGALLGTVDGTLEVVGGTTLNLLGNLTGHAGGLDILSGGILNIGNGGLLSGAVEGVVNRVTNVTDLTGVLNFDHSNNVNLIGGIVGGAGGLLSKDGGGVLSLLGDLTKFEGDTDILGGILQIGNGGLLSGTLGGAVEGVGSLLTNVTDLTGILHLNHGGDVSFLGDLTGGLSGAGGLLSGLLNTGSGGGLVGNLLSNEGLLNLGLLEELGGGLIKGGEGRLSLLTDLTGFVGDTIITGGLLQIGDGEGGLLGGLSSNIGMTVNGLLGFNLAEGDGTGGNYIFDGDLIGGTVGGLLGKNGLVGGLLGGVVGATGGVSGTLTGLLDGDLLGGTSGLLGGLIKDGDGKLSLVGDLTGFLGDTAILDGILQIGDGSGVIGGAVNGVLDLVTNVTHLTGGLVFDYDGDINHSGSIIGGILGNVTGTLSHLGDGQLNLLGDLTKFTGNTIIGTANSVLSIGNGGNLLGGVVGGAVNLVTNVTNLTGELIFNHSGNVNLGSIVDGDLVGGLLSGAGLLTKTGSGVLNLVGNLTGFTGDTNILGGILNLGNGAGLDGLVGGVVGGALEGTLDLVGDITIGAGSLLGFNHSDSVVVGGDGLLSGVGGLLKLGTGLLDLTGAGGLNFTGDTLLLGGGLKLDLVGGLVGNVVGSLGSVLHVTDGEFGGDILGLVTGAAGGLLNQGVLDGLLAGGLSPTVITDLVSSGILDGLLAGGLDTGTICSLVNGGLLDGVVGGLGSLVKNGTGVLDLTGDLLNLDNLLVNGGILNIVKGEDSDGALGLVSNLVSVAEGGTLNFNRGDEDFSFIGNIVGGITGGTVDGLLSGGALEDLLTGTAGTVIKQGEGDMNMTGSITAGLVEVQNGILRLSDSSQSSGSTSRLLRAMNAGPSTRAGGLGDILDILGDVTKIVIGGDGDDGIVTGILTNLTGTHEITGHLTTEPGDTETIFGIEGGSGVLTLLGSLLGFTSDISVTDGILNIGQGNIGVGESGDGVTGIVGDLVNNILVGVGGKVGINTVSDAEYSGLLSGVGTLVKNGAGTLTLLPQIFGGGGKFTGTIQVGEEEGPVAGNLLRLTDEGLAGNLLSGILFTVTEGAGLELFTDDGGIFDGALSGLGDIIKLGDGTLTILGSNSGYRGNISHGVDNDGNAGEGDFQFDDDDDDDPTNDDDDINTGVNIEDSRYSVIFNRTDNINYNGVVSGVGNVIQRGTGDITMTRDNDYEGTLTIEEGSGTLYLTGKNDSVSATTIESGATLSIGKGGPAGSLSGPITNDGNLVFDRLNDFAHAGLITGGGTLTKKGVGTMTLTASNTYTGVTSVAKGMLVLTGDNSAATGATTIAEGAGLIVGAGEDVLGGGTTGTLGSETVTNNGLLAFNRSDDITNSADISGKGTVMQLGDGEATLAGDITGESSVYQMGNGDMTLTGNNTFTGVVDQQGTGTMTLAGSGEYGFIGLYARGGTVAVGPDATLPDAIAQLVVGNEGTFDFSQSATKNGGPLLVADLIVGNVYRDGGSAPALDAQIITNDTGLDIRDEEILFYVPPSTAPGDTLLDVDGNVILSGEKVTIDLAYANGRPPVGTGDDLQLITATGTFDSEDDSIDVINVIIGEDGKPVVGEDGKPIGDGYTVEVTENGLIATKTDEASVPGGGGSPYDNAPYHQRMKAYAESQLAGMAFTVQGQDFVINQGISSAMNATSGRGTVVGGFGSIGASSTTYNTGSHVDVDGQTIMVGLAVGNSSASGRFSIGAFFENGDGSYETYNSFNGLASVNGEGDTSYTGGGLLVRYDVESGDAAGMYVDASARMGQAETDFRTADIDYNTTLVDGGHVSYENSMNYYSFHTGLGYVMEFGNSTELDLSAKVLWTNQEGADYAVYGDEVSMDDSTSLRTRLGGRVTFLRDAIFSPFLGAYWEHEFDGEVTSRVNGVEIEAPSMRGDTAMGEMGFAFTPSYRIPLTFDLSIRGYTGKHKGVGGALQLKFAF